MLTNKLNVFFPLTFIKHFISKLKVELNLKVRYFGGNHFALGRRQGNLGQSTHYLLTLPTTYCTGQRHLSGLGNKKISILFWFWYILWNKIHRWTKPGHGYNGQICVWLGWNFGLVDFNLYMEMYGVHYQGRPYLPIQRALNF